MLAPVRGAPGLWYSGNRETILSPLRPPLHSPPRLLLSPGTMTRVDSGVAETRWAGDHVRASGSLVRRESDPDDPELHRLSIRDVSDLDDAAQQQPDACAAWARLKCDEVLRGAGAPVPRPWAWRKSRGEPGAARSSWPCLAAPDWRPFRDASPASRLAGRHCTSLSPVSSKRSVCAKPRNARY